MDSLLILLINPDRNTDRLGQAVPQLEAQGLAHTRMAAVDGRRIDLDALTDYDDRSARRYLGRGLSGGEIGCYKSHMKCLDHFLASPAKHALILEDDMVLAQDVAAMIGQIATSLDRHDSDWDIVSLCARKHKIYTPLAGFGNTQLVRAHYFPMLSTGLLWSRAGAARFLLSHSRIFAPYDNALRHWQARAGRGFSVIPPMITSSGADSDIGQGERRNRELRTPFYGICKQRRLIGDKLRAWNQKRRCKAQEISMTGFETPPRIKTP